MVDVYEMCYFTTYCSARGELYVAVARFFLFVTT